MKFIEKLKHKAKKLKTEVIALYIAFNDKRTPLLPKIIIAITISYALSPIDLIPDFIPILGYIDDLIILPFLIYISIKVIPGYILEECRKKAIDQPKLNKRIGIFMAIIIAFIWILIFVTLITKILNYE